MSYGTTVLNGTTYTLYGFPGSTAIDEFNRLANGGGSYPSKAAYLDEQGACNKWTGAAYGTGIQASLNHKVNSSTPPVKYLGINAAANAIAGITDPHKYVELVTALRIIAS